MKEIKGDLIELAEQGYFDVIVHGCNCFCTMGGGIAKQIAKRYPEARKIDKQTEFGGKNKLGSYSVYRHNPNSSKCFSIVNAYTQYSYGPGKHTSYDAVDKVFECIYHRFHGARIGYPLIGAGLGGGHWPIIREIIDYRLRELDHTLVIYNK